MDCLDLRSLLIIGGARSGKSRFGQTCAEQSGKKPVLIATAEPGDAEMAARIAAHRAARGSRWQVVEERIELVHALCREAAEDKVLLVDCLTLWLSNLMLLGRDPEAEGALLAQSIERLAGPAIFVSNEVGLGIVPENELGRRFRDAQGRLNQRIAATCAAVVLVAAGLPVIVKPAPHVAFRL
ncbi:MAG TPA: bifunctional adenosylcobinamide kinase/adenosylcobinamide-phosphate guanylyltransferase [Methylovirgula sp.]|nr:bifunctional adenosylcobinamide kinase/adenosylcobinamide-phosphate guanylyltransferase [Methylovirgula sp.]